MEKPNSKHGKPCKFLIKDDKSEVGYYCWDSSPCEHIFDTIWVCPLIERLKLYESGAFKKVTIPGKKKEGS